MPPLIPVLLPLVVAAILASIMLTWLLPPPQPEGEAPAARFVDVTDASGIRFVHKTGGADPELSPTTLGAGVVCLDYDRDGDVDLFFVNRGPWPWEDDYDDPAAGLCRLFQNDGAGRFTDVSRAARLDVELLGMSAAVGDFDNDGFPDLLVTCVGQDQLFRNKGDGTFENVTDFAGIGGDPDTWSTGAAWIDFDEDGDLDLIVSHYARWPGEIGLQMAFVIANVGRTYGTPTGFAPVFPSVYRNMGDGRFVPVTGGAGLREIDSDTGLPVPKALTVIPVDANGNGRLDLLFTYHAHDSSLFINQGDGEFRKSPITIEDRREGASADMAAASRITLTQSTGRDQRFAALAATAGRSEEETVPGIADLGAKGGVALLDYDGDGRIDIFDGGGRAEPDTHRFDRGRAFATRPQVMWNTGNGWISAPLAEESSLVDRSLVARGVATADFDGDGDLDVVISAYGEAAVLLRNEQRLNPPWLQIELEATRGARDAYGARVEIHTPRRIHVQSTAPGNTLFAQSARTLFFGLSEDTRVQKVVVRWPGGTRQETEIDGINRRIVLVEP